MSVPNSVLATTLQMIREQLSNNSYEYDPLLGALDEAGAIERVTGGGTRIDQAVMFGRMSAITPLVSGYESVSMAVRDPFQSASYPWSAFTSYVTWNDVERLTNRGTEAIVNALKGKTTKLVEEMRAEMVHQIFRGGSLEVAGLTTLNGMGSAAYGLRPASAPDTIGWFQSAAFRAQTTNVVGGLSKTTFGPQNWNNQVFDSADNFDLAHLDSLLSACQLYSSVYAAPDLIFLSPKAYNAFKASQRSLVAIGTVPGRDGLNNTPILTYGGAKVFQSPHLGYTNTAGDDVSGMVLSSRDLRMYFDTDAEFDLGEFVPVPGTANQAARLLVRAQLVTGQLATHGVLINAES